MLRSGSWDGAEVRPGLRRAEEMMAAPGIRGCRIMERDCGGRGWGLSARVVASAWVLFCCAARRVWAGGCRASVVGDSANVAVCAEGGAGSGRVDTGSFAGRRAGFPLARCDCGAGLRIPRGTVDGLGRTESAWISG